jgi:hypothetical protein
MKDPFAAESYKTPVPDKYLGRMDWVLPTKVGGAVWIGCSSWSGRKVKTTHYELKAAWPDGRWASYRHAVPMYRHVAWQGGEVYWVAAEDGLLRLRLTGKGGKSRLVLDKKYPRIILPNTRKWMTIAADGGLWVRVSHGELMGLYRIELPPLDKKKD